MSDLRLRKDNELCHANASPSEATLFATFLGSYVSKGRTVQETYYPRKKVRDGTHGNTSLRRHQKI
jgi:hypothetical protein